MEQMENAVVHKDQLNRLQQKDPEFYEFLKVHDKELLEFSDEDIDEDEIDENNESDGGDLEYDDDKEETDDFEGTYEGDFEDVDEAEKAKSSSKGITSEIVDSWCNSIRHNTSLGAVRSLLRAFRAACHYGDDDNDSANKLSDMSSGVFNKVMQFVLSEMDGILRGLFKLTPSGANKDSIINMKNTKQWKNYNHLVKSYLGNSLHVLNQMTDTTMITYTLGRLRYSSIFLAAFPALLRKYVKVILHFWGTRGGALPVVSFLFLRDLCLHLGSECIDDCFKGMYKAYIFNCESVNAPKLQHIQFLGNCLVELVRLDHAVAYQHAFIFIRQLAMILRGAVSGNKKELFRKVYGWKFINCLELWTGVICAYSSEADLRALAYPLAQIISGAARLVPTAQYFPLRLRCIRMVNRIALSTGTFIPVSLPLLDMLGMKELNRPPTGGVGNAVDFRTVLKVKKSELKTRSFQEACVFSVIEELNVHLVQWSYSVAFFELSFIPVVRLRNFCKSTKVERFRREMRQLIHQIEANCEFTNKKRATISLRPNDLEEASFLERFNDLERRQVLCLLDDQLGKDKYGFGTDLRHAQNSFEKENRALLAVRFKHQDEKKSGSSPLSQYAASLRQRAQERDNTMMESSVLVGEHASVFGSKLVNDNGENVKDTEVFSSSWLPGNDARALSSKEEKKEKKKKKGVSQEKSAFDEDIVEDLVLSSDEECSPSEDEEEYPVESKQKPSAPKLHSKGKPPESNLAAPKLHSKRQKPKTAAQKLHNRKAKPAVKGPIQSKRKLVSSVEKSSKRKKRN